MDFKAGWPCGPGRCHPLTILDDHSRYALGLAACANQRTATVRAHLVAAFQRYGLPDRLLVDNGSPWGQRPGASLHPAHRLAAPLGHRRQPQPALPSADAGQGRALPRHPAARPWGAAAAARPGRLADRLRCLAARVQPCPAPTRAWPWRCPPLAITSAPGPIPPSCRPCPTVPTTTSVASRRAAGCRFRAASSGCPRRCAASLWRCDPPPPMAAGPSAS